MANAEGTLKRRKNNETKTIRKEIYYQSSWVDLPQELLDIISSDLNIVNYLRFGRVYRSWRIFISEHKHRFMSSQSPLVTYMSNRFDENSCFFFDMASRMRYKINLPNDIWNVKLFLGVSSGYLIMHFMKRHDILGSYFWLINPVTVHQLQFPPVSFPFNLMKLVDVFRTIFGSIASQEQNFLIRILPKTLKVLPFFISRDNQWRYSPYCFADWRILNMVVFYSRIFVVTDDSRIGILNLRFSDMKFLEIKFAPPFGSHFIRLVASNDQLLIVDFTKVYRIDFSRMEWVKVNNVGGQSLFIVLGDKICSKLINPTMWGG